MTGFKKRKDERRVKARALIIEEEKKVKYLNKVEKKKYREEINEQYENIKEAQRSIFRDFDDDDKALE